MFGQAKKKTKVCMEWVHISPNVAAQVLDFTRSSQFPQRGVSKAIAGRYANEMREGTWHKDTADVVRLCDYEGGTACMDGQHRLEGIVKSGLGQDMWVATGVPEEAFKYIDQGAPRTLSHVMTAAGWPAPGILSAVGRMLHEYAEGNDPTSNKGIMMASGTLFDWVEGNHSDICPIWDTYGTDIRKAGKRCHINEAGMLFFFYLWEKSDHDRAVKLIEYLADTYEGTSPDKVYGFMLKKMDENNDQFTSMKAQQMAVRTEMQKYLQLQVMRYAWICASGKGGNPKTPTGFCKLHNAWLKAEGSDRSWNII